jgi:glucosamine--fructose-6-phosphate aminotransferase (isomerizing)
MTADVMLRQVQYLARDLSENLDAFDHQARQAIAACDCPHARTVYLVGCGDSLHAGYAARMAFQTLAGVQCTPLGAQEFVGYSALPQHRAAGERVLVICTSASGNTPRVLEAIVHAQAQEMPRVAITGNPDSALGRGAHPHLLVTLRDTWPAPGVRTFQASLVGMLLLAIALGESNGHLTTPQAAEWRARLAQISNIVQALGPRLASTCKELGATIAASPALYFLGSGPSLGTALFSAAKMVEACGVLAVAQDLEEWWHVERFAYPVNTPMCILAPPGESRLRAFRLAEQACQAGRNVILISAEAAIPDSLKALPCVHIADDVCEAFSPLVYAVFAPVLAHFTAVRLSRGPFQTQQ